MWIWLTLASALLLGSYDVAKKFALKRNDVYYVLLAATALTTLFLSPFLKPSSPLHHFQLLFKAVLVSCSWVSGMIALKLLPITTVSTLKGSRPVFVLLFSIIIFGERLNALQWVGVLLVLASIWLLSLASAKEGISFGNNKGVFALFISIFAGVASALWDKYIITGMDPLFVQSWTNLYITVILGLIIVIKQLADKKKLEKFHWDWTLLLIAVLITLADALYFFALKQPDAMLGVISIIRRSSIIVSFVLGAFIFKEKMLKRKSLALVLMLGGVILTMFGTL